MSYQSFSVPGSVPEPARRLGPLVQQFGKLSKHAAWRAIHDGAVRVNGRVCRRTEVLLGVGDRVDIQMEDAIPSTPEVRAGKDATNFEVVFEDRDVIVVHKPPRLLTVPTPRREGNTLISLVTRHLRRADARAEAYCVHRLDRGVSGLLVFAKRLDIAEMLREQFAARKPRRLYVAIVLGQVRLAAGEMRSYLATDKATLDQYSTDEEAAGQLAITHYRVRTRMAGATLVEVMLETGRRNQIRVHFAEAGHPLLGDTRYGRNQIDTQRLWPFPRIALHAASLGFDHPVTGQALSFDTKLPNEFHSFLRAHGLLDAGDESFDT